MRNIRVCLCIDHIIIYNIDDDDDDDNRAIIIIMYCRLSMCNVESIDVKCVCSVSLNSKLDAVLRVFFLP